MNNELNLLTKAVRNGLGTALALSLATIPLAAMAQDQNTDEEEAYLEEVIVTGSRLQDNPNLTSSSAVLSVSGDEADIRGNVRIEDFVNIMPQVFAAQAGEVSNGASGTAQLDLRGLGAQRTLVLIDGFRLPYGSSQSSPANVDLIPMQLVERVDILTGGASAVYGSDAVGGVANFILKRDFEGVELGYQYGTQYNSNDDSFWESVLNAANQPVPGSETDGEENNFHMILGANSADGRGNVTVFASYEDRKGVWQRDRIFSACSMGQDDGPESFGGYGCIGSGNYRLFVGPGGAAFQEDDGTIVPYQGGPSQTFNFGAFNFFQRPSERFQIYAKSHFAFADNHEAFLDVSYVNNTSDAQIAPTASFGTSSYTINCDNPFIQNTPGLNLATDIYGCTPEDIANGAFATRVGASHRNVEGGPRNSRLENSALRLVAGLRGSFGDSVWGYEAFAMTSETRDQSESQNDFVIANLDAAFLATLDANGNPVCLGGEAGCVPYNPFQRPGGQTAITQEQINWLHGIGLVNGETSQQVFGANVQADLGEYGVTVPTADYGLRFLAGLEYRKDTLDARPDEISQVPGGGFTGVGGATLPVAGKVEVDEFYTEFELPLVSQVFLMEELTLRGQYRYSDYSRTGNDTQSDVDTDTYGISLAWAPIYDLRFRGQFQRSVRAPNVIELYTGQNTNLPNLNPAGTNANGVQLYDPCASDAPIESLAACQNTGVTAEQYGRILDVISGQTQSLTGGNPFLDPESADTYTFGVVWTPEFASGLSVSVDWFEITVEDAIQAGISAQTTLDSCLATGDPTFCDLIQRNFDGSLASGSPGVGFQQTNINIAELSTTGVDFQVVYDFDFGNQAFRVDYASTWLDSFSFVAFPGAEEFECAGFFGNNCAGTLAPVNPEYRHRAVLNWYSPWSIDVNFTWRYFGSTDNDSPGEELETKLDSVNYLDLAAAWQVTDNLQLRGTVLNLLGEDPPVFTGAGPALGNGNTYPVSYDTGTTMYFGIRLNY